MNSQVEHVRQLPRFQANVVFYFKDKSDEFFNFVDDIPKDIMDNYESILGNGAARVSVSADMGIKTFGTGAGAMVTVSLSCNQDEKTVQQAIALATQAAIWYASQNRQLAENEVVRTVEERKRTGTGPNFA